MVEASWDPLVSIIVPVYQVRPYLDDCLRSLAAQSHSRLEVILVDDGSTDGSSDVCDAWATYDERFKAIHTRNRGLSEARNRGLEELSGDYVTFVDSDDVISPRFVECLLDACRASRADVAMTSIQAFHGSLPEFSAKCPSFSTETAREALVRIATAGRGWEACAKLFRAEVFAGRRFTAGLLYEDLDIMPRLLEASKTVVSLHEPLYGYRVRDTGIMGTSRRKMSSDLLAILDGHIEQAEGMKGSDGDALVAGYLRHASGRLMTIDPDRVSDNRSFVAAYRTFVRRHLKHLILNPKLGLRSRLEITLCALYPTGMIRLKDSRRKTAARLSRG